MKQDELFVHSDVKDEEERYCYPLNLIDSVLREYEMVDHCVWDYSVLEFLNALNALDGRKVKILESRYKYDATYRELGNLLNLSHERVRQLELQARHDVYVILSSGNCDFAKLSDYRELKQKYERLLVKYNEVCEQLKATMLVDAAKDDSVDCVDHLADPIDTLGLQNRTRNILHRAGLRTVGAVIAYDKNPGVRWKDLRGAGYMTLENLQEVFKEKVGYTLNVFYDVDPLSLMVGGEILSADEAEEAGALRKLFSESLESLGLTRRALNALERENLRTIGDVITYDKYAGNYLEFLEGMGINSLLKLRDVIKEKTGYEIKVSK